MICEIWHQFLTPVAFELPQFWNGTAYRKSKTQIGIFDYWHMAFSKLLQFGSPKSENYGATVIFTHLVIHLMWLHRPENPPGRPSGRRISPWKSPS